MNHKNILTRAWHILWTYKTLWVFGILLALTTSTFTNRVFQFGDNSRRIEKGETGEKTPFLGESFQDEIQDIRDELNLFFNETVPEEFTRTMVTIAILVGCFLLIFILIRILLRYVSEVAIIQLANDYEATGKTYTWREGFKFGWSRTAWQLFLIDLMVNIPVFIAFVLLFTLILAPFFLWSTGVTTLALFGSVLSIGLFVLGIFLVIIVSAGLGLLKSFFRRACVLDRNNGMNAIRKGFSVVRNNLIDVLLMWLIIVGINIGFGIAIIPIVILMVIVALILAGMFGLTAGGITSIFASGTMPIVVGAIVGSPVFFLVLITPLAFLRGLKETYTSTSWTLTYRELEDLAMIGPNQSELPFDPMEDDPKGADPIPSGD